MASLTASELAALAAKQHGLMTHAQATSAGFSRTALSRLVRAGVWELVRPRVFRRAAASQTDAQALMALCLWLGESAVVQWQNGGKRCSELLSFSKLRNAWCNEQQKLV